MELFRGRANGLYYLEKFCRHLAVEHGLVLKEYCQRYLGVVWPRCPVTGEEVGYKLKGAGVLFRTYKRFAGVTKAMSPKVAAAAENAKVTRMGSGNPMFGGTAWNNNLPPNHPYRAAMAARRRGVVEGPETRLKHQLNRAAHPRKARHTTPHSSATKELIALRTARMHERHAFGRESSIHCRLRQTLASLGLCPAEEFCVGHYSLDFAVPNLKLAIEADGDFFHCHPELYPNGPTCSIQRRNFKNDKAKNAFLKQAGWTVLRFWETDILKADFPAKLRAALVQASALEA